MALNAQADWWKQAVVYQVYPRSFRDANGDGLGDILGVVDRMDYLAALGIDAIWLSPFYPSELADGGYDVIDYRNVDPRLGTLDDFDQMVAAAHDRGIRVVVDIVPNHTSNKHAWFQEALASSPGSAARDRYIFRPGRGDAGEFAPNGWQSSFGGPAWEPVGDGTWYLHLFATEQPDLNWDNPEVREDFIKTLRFWSDRGVDGFRVDVAHMLVKDWSRAPLEDLDWWPISGPSPDPTGYHPVYNRPGVHDIYKTWRQVFNEYDPPRFAVAEAWVAPDQQYAYASTDELGQVFNFEFAKANWCAEDFRTAIDQGLASAEKSGSTTTWVLSNHDVPRHPTRFGLPQVPAASHHQLVNDWLLRDGKSYVENRELGTRRARAALLMELGLPGSAYLYEGEELGLFEVADIPWDRLEDPTARNTNHGSSQKGRDGCRVPLPWDSSDKPEPAAWNPAFGDGATGSFGFSARTAGARPAEPGMPHLPQPLWFSDFAADRQEDDPASMLALYRAALKLRAEKITSTGRTDDFAWMDPALLGTDPSQVIGYERRTADGRTLASITNFGAAPVTLPEGEVVLASVDLEGNELPQDASAWVLI